jgi:hypothetical protein
MSKVKQALAILLAVLFIVTVTASAVSAYDPNNWCGTPPHTDTVGIRCPTAGPIFPGPPSMVAASSNH